MKILFFFSDTGGGHRAAAEAIIAALEAQSPGRHETVMVDALSQATWPISTSPRWYRPIVTYAPWLWGWGYQWTDSPLGLRLLGFLLPLVLRRAVRQALARERPDLVVSVHPLLECAVRHEMDANTAAKLPRVPFVTVVTDLLTTHLSWYTGQPDLCIVPTDRACQMAVQMGVPRERVQVIGLPVSLKFAVPATESKEEVRERLGLIPTLRTLLLVGGGEGMGPLYRITSAIASGGPALQLAVITGRNPALKKQIESTRWPIPVQVTGFVTNMPDWMRASDLIVTKAGPGTIMEALACGLPILLSGFLPGQEEGNVQFVVENGVGELVQTPEKIAATVRAWFAPDNLRLERMQARAHELARPRAAFEIASALDRFAPVEDS